MDSTGGPTGGLEDLLSFFLVLKDFLSALSFLGLDGFAGSSSLKLLLRCCSSEGASTLPAVCVCGGGRELSVCDGGGVQKQGVEGQCVRLRQTVMLT